MSGDEALVLGAGRSLAGILARPDSHANVADVAVMILNAGMIHRAGPARLHVRMARALAARGVAALRLDLSNLGDSAPRADNLPLLEAIVRDPQEVMDDLGRLGYSRFILVGICSGAYSAFKTACRDPRVIGAGLLNPQDFVGDPNWISYAWAQRYWKKSLFSARAWSNLLTGRIEYRRLFSVLSRQLGRILGGGGRNVSSMTQDMRREIDTLLERRVRLLLMFSAGDVSVEQFNLIFGRDVNAPELAATVTTLLLSDTDHLFRRSVDQARVIEALADWVVHLAHPAQHAGGPAQLSSRWNG